MWTPRELGGRFKDRPSGLGDEEWLRLRIVSLFELLDKRRPFFLALFAGVGAAPLFDRTAAFLEDYLLEFRFHFLGRDEADPPVPEALMAKMIVSTLAGLVSHWLKNPASGNARDIAGYYIRFVRGAAREAGYRETVSRKTAGR
jgi:hypothetical protein